MPKRKQTGPRAQGDEIPDIALVGFRMIGARAAAATADAYMARVAPFMNDTTHFFLVGRGLELILKSWLLGRGFGNEHLWDTCGHDLSKLLTKAEGKGFAALVGLTAGERRMVNALSELYADKLFEYVDVSPITLTAASYGDYRLLLDRWIGAVYSESSSHSDYEQMRDSTGQERIGFSVQR